jgi:hypothetical protein
MQVSTIPVDLIARRTIEYARRGISILWVSPFGEAGVRDGRGHSIHAWERFIHAMYGGTFYYWTEDEMLLPVHFQHERTEESADHLSLGIQIPHVGEPLSIADLELVSLPRKFTGETTYREVKLWCMPKIWIDREEQYVAISHARAKYPLLFPAIKDYPPLEDPFHAEDAPSDFSLRGFVEETHPELKDLFSQFYGKYGSSDMKLIWVSVDETPNGMHFVPDWWQRFRSEYIEANSHRRELLIEMLQEKLSGEKPSKHIKWPQQRIA